MTQQLALSLSFRPALEREDFLVSECNEQAVALIDQWPQWSSTAIVLHGPSGSGKTHLMHVWAARSAAHILTPDTLIHFDIGLLQDDTIKAIAIEDIDKALSARLPASKSEPANNIEATQDALFHIYNSMKNKGGHILILSEQPMNRLDIALPDLRSRLMGSPHIGIHAPDDDLLGGLLLKLFRDRQLIVMPDALQYCLSRMERNFDDARLLVERIDSLSLAEKRRITIPLIRTIFDAQEKQRQASLPID